MAQLLKRTVAVEAQKNGMALGFLGKEDGASVAAGITRLRARTAPVTAAMLSSARGRCKAGRNALFTISRYRASLAKRLRHRPSSLAPMPDFWSSCGYRLLAATPA